MSAVSAPAAEPGARRPPGFGGINLTVLRLEVRRLLRNRRTMIFAIILPVVLFLLIGTNKVYGHQRDGLGNVSAFIMISMALYGAALATTAGGAMVSIERALGWSRQLRLTPLSPPAYIAVKMITAMVLGLASVVAVFAAGRITNVPSIPGYLWFVSAICVWVGALVFAAFGLFVGYLFPSENVMQFIGFGVALLAFAGGLFYPVSSFPHALQIVAKLSPMYGVNELVHAPMLGNSLSLVWVVNAVAWLLIFSGGAVWRFRGDTGRV